MNKDNKGMTAAGYCRCNNVTPHEESIEAQKNAIKAYADQNGYLGVDWYIDTACTGSDRPAFQKLISDAKAGKFNCVIVLTFDRFSRTCTESRFYMQELKRRGVRIISVKESTGNPPTSQMLENIFEGMARYFSENLSKSVKKGLRLNAEKGIFNGGTPPFGYTIIDKNIAVNEAEAMVVRLIFDSAAGGKTLSEIAVLLKAQGYKSRLGHDFTTNAIKRILRNERYVGNYIYNSDEPVRIEGALPQIISTETFATVQKTLNAGKNLSASLLKPQPV